MSLLLDALKRAEQEKLARQGAPAQGPSPAAPKTAGASLELESIEAPRHAPAKAAPAVPGERSAAQNVFTAKQEDRPPESASSRKALVFGGVAVLLLVLGGGGYFWYQLQAVSSPARPASAVRPVTPAAPPASAPTTVAGGVPAPGAPQPGAAAPATSPAPPAPTPPGAEASAAPSVSLPKPAALVPEASRAKRPPQAAEQLVMDLLRDAGRKSAEPPLKLTRSMDAPPVLTDVAAGYEALRRGDNGTARRRYQAALAIEPASLDAILGLATADARSGGREQAQRLYRRALEIDPRNTVALAGLAALADYSRPAALEAELRADLLRYPQSAALHFTLGNLHASQARWSDAQTAYFEAHRLEPGNADVSHNLAVSLDQLGQRKLAAEYYGRALAQARGQSAQFDARAAERRLADLRR